MILAVSAWKVVSIIALVVCGIIGFCFRGFMDMAENWETGYGANSKKAFVQACLILGLFIVVAICVGVFV